MGRQPFIRQVIRTPLLVTCVFWLLVSCNGGGGRNTPGGPTLQSITVSPSNAAVALGKNQKFTATAHYSDGSSKPLPEATWTTSAPGPIQVTSNGLATSVAQGQFGVFATSGKITGNATLTVGPPPSIADELPSRCPTPSKQVQATCRAITYEDLPNGARGLLRELKCDVGPESSYDYGSAVDLTGDGSPEYQFCCHEAPHGPCGAVLIGKIGSEWRDLTAKEGMSGYEGPCNLFVVLESQHSGFHDLCLPNECAPPYKPGTCNQTVWRYDGTRYRLAETTIPEAATANQK
jgi:hypothetical protein